MWDTGSEFKYESQRNYSTPKIDLYFYDDIFTFGTDNWSGTYSKYTYNIKNTKRFFTDGTSTLEGIITNGTRIELDGIGTEGTWTSPILTSFYNGIYYKLNYDDSTAPVGLGDDLVYSENFETLNSIERNGAQINFGDGTLVYLGGQNDDAYNTAYWAKFINLGGELTQYQTTNANIPNSITETSEIHIKFRTDFLPPPTTNTHEIQLWKINTDAGGYQSLIITGTRLDLIYAKGMTTNTVTVGTIGTGNYYDSTISWNEDIADKLLFESWFNGTFIDGTLSIIADFGNFNSLELGKLDSVVGSSGTYFIDDFYMYGTKQHGTGWTGAALYNARYDYEIRTGTDGTNFNIWQDITGTRDYNLDTRSITSLNTLYIGTNYQEGEYFQVRAIMSHSDVSSPAYINQLKLYTYFDFDEGQVINMGNPSYKLEGQFKIGEITSNSVNFKLSNIESVWGSKEKLYGESGAGAGNEWQNYPLFYNRPAIFDTPVRVRAGFAGDWGTQQVPIGYYYMRKSDVSDNNLDINLSGVDSWGKFADLQAGTIEGTELIDVIVNHICDYNNIPVEKRFIDKVRRDYDDIPVVNTMKEEGFIPNAGGFNQIWNVNSLAVFNTYESMMNFSQNTYSMGTYLDYYIVKGWNIFQPNTPTWQQHKEDYLKLYNKDLYYIKELRRAEGLFSDTHGNKVTLGNFSNDDMLAFEYGQYQQSALPIHANQGSVLMWVGKIDNTSLEYTELGSFAGLEGSSNYDYDNCGIFYDSNIGTGVYAKNESGTVKLYRFNLDAGTALIGNGITWAGTTTLQAGAGTNFTITSAFMMQRPEDVYQGTALYWYCFTGYEGTLNYLYKFGTEFSSNGTFEEKVLLGSSFHVIGDNGTFGTHMTSSGWHYQDNILHEIGARIPNESSLGYLLTIGTNLAWHNDSYQIFNFGHHGFKFQHTTIDTLGAIKKDGATFATGSYTVNNGSTQFYFNSFQDYTSLFTVSYDIYGMNVDVGTLSEVTFKEALTKLQIPAFHYTYFDGDGNFHFHSRDRLTKGFTISDSVNRNEIPLIENPINANAILDIEKVKNVITVIGSQGTYQYVDSDSRDIYGTRNMADYTNTFIPSAADCGTMSFMLASLLNSAKYMINITIPFHPEIEIADTFKYVDGVNNIDIENITAKQITHDLKNFTTKITGEERKSNKLGEEQ